MASRTEWAMRGERERRGRRKEGEGKEKGPGEGEKPEHMAEIAGFSRKEKMREGKQSSGAEEV